MKCNNCGNRFARKQITDKNACPFCGQPLEGNPRSRAFRIALNTAIWVCCAVVLSLLIYKVYYWISDYNLVRLYTRGAYTPTVSAITMSDGRVGHAIVYYGEDGDQIFMPELGYSVIISGGTARFEFTDSDWFADQNVSQLEGVRITFSPTLISQKGSQTKLPTLEVYVPVPESPFTISSPKEDGITVYTSSYNIAGWVVPGSAVSINGEDISSYVDRAGNLSLDVKVQPIDNNVYTFLVQTENHRETRYDVTIYRQQLPIDIELDSSVTMTASNGTMTISGYTEPGAIVSVDTNHLEDSLFFDMQTGEFSFIVQFESIGNNLVRFRASMDGRQDAVISFYIYYVPARAQYINRAWLMDYKQLRLLFEQWHGYIFKCVGTIIDTATVDGQDYLIMDVGDGNTQQLIMLVNSSATQDVTIGRKYTAYADVNGRSMYKASYYPVLVIRYMDAGTGS